MDGVVLQSVWCFWRDIGAGRADSLSEEVALFLIGNVWFIIGVCSGIPFLSIGFFSYECFCNCVVVWQ